MNDNNAQSRLRLTLAKDGKEPFLRDACWIHAGGRVEPLDSKCQLQRKNSMRAVCILLLLAKYQGEGHVNKDREMVYSAEPKNGTWLGTLYTLYKDFSADEFMRMYFLGRNFFKAGRGSKGGKPAFASHLPDRLPLRQIQFYEVRPASKIGDEGELLTDENLARMAVTLEKEGGWDNPTVPLMLEQIRKKNQTHGRSGVHSGSELATVTASWKELIEFQGEPGERIRRRLEMPETGETWYVVCVAPMGLLGWIDHFRKAVELHEVTVKWAYQAPSAVVECRAVRALWEMLFSHACSLREVRQDGGHMLKGERMELARWARFAREAARQNGRKGGRYEFFESQIVHPYLAFMAVPPGMKSRAIGATAPKGTLFMAQLYPFFPDDGDARPGLFMETPGPVLNIYYRSIMRLFEEGPKRGYIKPVDLTRLPGAA